MRTISVKKIRQTGNALLVYRQYLIDIGFGEQFIDQLANDLFDIANRAEKKNES